jgi:NitT/TauT family transport system substrate-binding protein
MDQNRALLSLNRRSASAALSLLFAVGLALVGWSAEVHAQVLEKPSLKMTLEWAFQGPQAVFTSAQDNGFFKKEGLDVRVDRGSGSTDAVVKVAAGAYDIGWSEMSSIVKYNSEHPDNPLIAVYITHENSANAVISIRGRGIEKPKDLEGKKVGSTAGSAARDVFATFASANKIDAAKVSTQTVSGSLRETMLVHGDVDAILGAITSGVLTIKSLKVPESDIIVMTYGDYGVPLYGHAVFTTAAFAKANPRTVAAAVRAINNAWKSAITDPDSAVATLKSRDKIVDLPLERERLQLMLKRLVLTDHIRAKGLSTVTPEQLDGTIKTISAAYGIATPLRGEQVFDGRFLPSQAERMAPALKE